MTKTEILKALHLLRVDAHRYGAETFDFTLSLHQYVKPPSAAVPDTTALMQVIEQCLPFPCTTISEAMGNGVTGAEVAKSLKRSQDLAKTLTTDGRFDFPLLRAQMIISGVPVGAQEWRLFHCRTAEADPDTVRVETMQDGTREFWGIGRFRRAFPGLADDVERLAKAKGWME